MLIDRLKSAIPIIVIICLCFFLPLKYGRMLFIPVSALMLYLACHETFELLNPPHKKALKIIAVVYGLASIFLPMLFDNLLKTFENKYIALFFFDNALLITVILIIFFICLITYRKYTLTPETFNLIIQTISLPVLIPWFISLIPKSFCFLALLFDWFESKRDSGIMILPFWVLFEPMFLVLFIPCVVFYFYIKYVNSHNDTDIYNNKIKPILILYYVFNIVFSLLFALYSINKYMPFLESSVYFTDCILIVSVILVSNFILLEGNPKDANHHYSTSVIIGITVFIPWSLSFIPKLFFMNGIKDSDMRPVLFFMILVTKIADTGAFAAGSWTAKRPDGNHKLIPLVSPKKSWEGLIGGTVASVVTALLCYFYWPGSISAGNTKLFGITEVIIIGILASVIGLLGDLAESALKRAAGAKDSGHLPGIGGILDTLDSLLFVSPLFYCYILISTFFKELI